MRTLPGARRLLLENGDWALWEGVLAAGFPNPVKARRSLESMGKRLRQQLGLRADPFSFREVNGGVSQIKTSGIAGTISLGEIAFEIAPKFAPQGRGLAEWSASALILMQYARKRDLALIKSQYVGVQRHGFVDLLAMAFADTVESALADQVILRYRTTEQSLSVVRGRVHLARQLRTVFTQPHILECEVDELDADNEFNGLLKWAANAFSAAARDPALRRKMADLAGRLPGKPNRNLALKNSRVQPPPQFRAWSEALDIAALFSSGLTHSALGGRRLGYSFVFNMERLFEHFVELSLARAVSQIKLPGIGASRQVSTAYAHPKAGTKVRFYSRPDNLVTSYGRPLIAVDAKYKRLSDSEGMKSSKPQNADVYELVAAMTAHNCHHGLLLYPRVLGDMILDDQDLHTWSIHSFGTTLTISALALDLSVLRSHSDLHIIDMKIAQALSPLLADIS